MTTTLMDAPARPSWPLLDGRPVPPLPAISRRRYCDEDFYRLELQHVFARSWLFAGYVSQFPKAGSYRLLDIEIAPVVVVRGKDGALRAFLNSCQHRGASVLRDTEGCVKALSCQYHGWTYDLEGRLVGVPDTETFPDLDMAAHRLRALRCDQWGGLVFVSLDPAAPPLLDWLTPALTAPFDPLVGQDLRVVSIKTIELNCNWKLSAEAFRESYHFDFIHRDTVVKMANYKGTRIHLTRHGHGILSVPYWPAASDWAGQPNLSGLGLLDGADRPDLRGNVQNPVIFPNLSMAFQDIGFPVVVTWPTARDRCKVTAMWLGKDWGAGPRPAAWDAVLAAHQDVIDEDLKNLVSMQRALEADPDAPIPLSTQEVAIYQLHAEIDRAIGAGRIAPAMRVPDILDNHYAARPNSQQEDPA